jgi:hypothetical protein
MRSTLRFLTYLATGLSCAFFLAAIALLIRGYHVADELKFGYFDYRPRGRVAGFEDASMVVALHDRGHWDVALVRKGCVVRPNVRYDGPGPNNRRWDLNQPTGRDLQYAQVWTLSTAETPVSTTLGFRHATAPYSNSVRIPDWFLIALTALLPTVYLVHRRTRRSRQTTGHCQACGYDLRATPERCPECGTVPIISPAWRPSARRGGAKVSAAGSC